MHGGAHWDLRGCPPGRRHDRSHAAGAALPHLARRPAHHRLHRHQGEPRAGGPPGQGAGAPSATLAVAAAAPSLGAEAPMPFQPRSEEDQDACGRSPCAPQARSPLSQRQPGPCPPPVGGGLYHLESTGGAATCGHSLAKEVPGRRLQQRQGVALAGAGQGLAGVLLVGGCSSVAFRMAPPLAPRSAAVSPASPPASVLPALRPEWREGCWPCLRPRSLAGPVWSSLSHAPPACLPTHLPTFFAV